MAFFRDVWGVLTGQAVAPNEVVGNSMADLLLALEKRAVSNPVENSVAAQIAAIQTAVAGIDGRTSDLATMTALASVAMQIDTVLGRVPANSLQTLLDRVPPNLIQRTGDRVLARASEYSRQTTGLDRLNTLLGRLTSARAGYLDALNGFSAARVKGQVFTSNGTWVRPSGIDTVWVSMVGGGQAGGHAINMVGSAGESSSFGTLTVPGAPRSLRGTDSNTGQSSLLGTGGGQSQVGGFGAGGGGADRSFGGVASPGLLLYPRSVSGNVSVSVGAGGSRTTAAAGSGGPGVVIVLWLE